LFHPPAIFDHESLIALKGAEYFFRGRGVKRNYYRNRYSQTLGLQISPCLHSQILASRRCALCTSSTTANCVSHSLFLLSNPVSASEINNARQNHAEDDRGESAEQQLVRITVHNALNSRQRRKIEVGGPGGIMKHIVFF
jgi:hypothetical protein